MREQMLSTQVLENILKETISALDDGRSQIFEVAEVAREERDRTEVVLKQVRLETHQAILLVEQLEKEFSQIRFRLYTVNKEFEDYGEKAKKDVYEEAIRLREQLTAAKEREKMLRQQRDDLDQTFVKLQEIVQKAEQLVSQVGVALNYLSQSIQDVHEQITNVYAREHMGQEMLHVQEIERKRMANSLHDGPVQDLANLVVQLELHERLYLGEWCREAQQSFDELKGIARGCMGEMRRIIYDLNPMTLEDLGLVPTVRNVLNYLETQTDISTRLNLLGKETRLHPKIETTLFRIIQECLNNSRKHANPTRVEVVMEYSPFFVNVEISDDGKGFNFTQVQEMLKSGGHYGLLSMQNRAQLLDGTLRIKTEPGMGTKVLVQIPLNGQNGGF